MTVRIYTLDDKDQSRNNSIMSQAFEIENYGEFMKMLKYTNYISDKDGVLRKVESFYFNPPEYSEQMPVIDIYTYVE